jgi:guanyl-specific ribonuclease Sa
VKLPRWLGTIAATLTIAASAAAGSAVPAAAAPSGSSPTPAAVAADTTTAKKKLPRNRPKFDKRDGFIPKVHLDASLDWWRARPNGLPQAGGREYHPTPNRRINGGRQFFNWERRLPTTVSVIRNGVPVTVNATYYEYDVYMRGLSEGRDANRIVHEIRSNRWWYTDDHYLHFHEFRR